MILVHSKLLAFLMALVVVMLLGYSWDYLTEMPRHRKLKSTHKGGELDD